jgi:hypothetical protein
MCAKNYDIGAYAKFHNPWQPLLGNSYDGREKERKKKKNTKKWPT